MRLIVEWEYGNSVHGGINRVPIIYESKEKLLNDFQKKWDQIIVTDLYEGHSFRVAGIEFLHDDMRNTKFKNHPEVPKYMDYEDVNNFEFEIIYPNVYTVDEWFDEAENDE